MLSIYDKIIVLFLRVKSLLNLQIPSNYLPQSQSKKDQYDIIIDNA